MKIKPVAKATIDCAHSSVEPAIAGAKIVSASTA